MNSTTIQEVVDPGLFGLPECPPHERVLIASDRATGLRVIIAIHSTARGPAFGGCRYWTYASDAAALEDALRLSRGMSYKNALADLPFGGGKAVVLARPGYTDRRAIFEALGRIVMSLAGSYVTAEDVGTSINDMLAVRRETPYVSGIPRVAGFGGDPSPMTAYGVYFAIEAAVHAVLGPPLSRDVTVAVQGLGAVGWSLCARLADAGCRLVVADLDGDRVARACEQFGARAVSVDEIVTSEADVFAPCALGGALNESTVDEVRAKVIAGAANNQLRTLEDGDRLHERGIFYVPDYLANAGGMVSAAAEYLGHGDEGAVMFDIARIADRTRELIARVSRSGKAPARVADAWALERIVAPG